LKINIVVIILEGFVGICYECGDIIERAAPTDYHGDQECGSKLLREDIPLHYITIQ